MPWDWAHGLFGRYGMVWKTEVASTCLWIPVDVRNLCQISMILDEIWWNILKYLHVFASVCLIACRFGYKSLPPIQYVSAWILRPRPEAWPDHMTSHRDVRRPWVPEAAIKVGTCWSSRCPLNHWNSLDHVRSNKCSQAPRCDLKRMIQHDPTNACQDKTEHTEFRLLCSPVWFYLVFKCFQSKLPNPMIHHLPMGLHRRTWMYHCSGTLPSAPVECSHFGSLWRVEVS